MFVIKEVLRASEVNFEIDVAKDGQEALRYLQTPPVGQTFGPALVLLDLNIPKVSGLEVLRELRADSRYDGTPVIIVSSSRAEEDRSMAAQLGANGYFQKPVDLKSYKELAQVVIRALGPRQR